MFSYYKTSVVSTAEVFCVTKCESFGEDSQVETFYIVDDWLLQSNVLLLTE